MDFNFGTGPDDLRLKVEQDSSGWTVYTSRNSNGWWAVGINFPTERAANIVADAIWAAVPEQLEAQ